MGPNENPIHPVKAKTVKIPQPLFRKALVAKRNTKERIKAIIEEPNPALMLIAKAAAPELNNNVKLNNK